MANVRERSGRRKHNLSHACIRIRSSPSCSPQKYTYLYIINIRTKVRVQEGSKVPSDLLCVVRVVPVPVVGQVDRGYAAFAELTLDGVTAFESGVQAGDGMGHQLGTRSFNSSKKFWTRMSSTLGASSTRNITNR